MKIWICQWNFHWRISNTRLDRMTCLRRRRSHQITQHGSCWDRSSTSAIQIASTQRQDDRPYHIHRARIRRRKLPTADFFTFVISRRQYSLRLILSSSSYPSLSSRILFKFLKVDPPEVVNHFETEDIFLITHSVLSEPVSSMKLIDFQRKTKIFDIQVITNVISRRISRHVQKMRCTDPQDVRFHLS